MFDYDLPLSYQFGWVLLIVSSFLLLTSTDLDVRHILFVTWCLSVGLIIYGYNQKD